VTILASSREALRTDGEQAYRVPSLSLPDPKQVHTPASIAPFEQCNCSSTVLCSLALTLRSVTRTLRRWHPFAIGWTDSAGHRVSGCAVRSLSVEEISRKLTSDSDSSRGSRTALPRQQTLRSSIDWSYDLLNDSKSGCCNG
jgi:predicted ATPase